ncbi:unnamed protein product [Prorocentrum cordatum]|uniref:Reverse transcriptase domain-containing protein n=1 Tax=Prorocentrum cordatum TaxID=2364126 RepID=A0ABN9UTV5_9DINO|nr:unnamed protein product [Polarella glacialis]
MSRNVFTAVGTEAVEEDWRRRLFFFDVTNAGALARKAKALGLPARHSGLSSTSGIPNLSEEAGVEPILAECADLTARGWTLVLAANQVAERVVAVARALADCGAVVSIEGPDRAIASAVILLVAWTGTLGGKSGAAKIRPARRAFAMLPALSLLPEGSGFTSNHPSFEDNYGESEPPTMELIRSYLSKGFGETFGSEAEATARFGQIFPASLGNVRKRRHDGSFKNRIIQDLKTNKVNLTASTHERAVLPRGIDHGVDLAAMAQHALRCSEGVVKVLILDFKGAFMSIPLHEQERRFNVAVLQQPPSVDSGRVIVWRVLGFGGKSNPLVYSRFASFVARSTQAMLSADACRLQLYVDDPALTLAGGMPLQYFHCAWTDSICQRFGATTGEYARGALPDLGTAELRSSALEAFSNAVYAESSRASAASRLKTCRKLLEMWDQVGAALTAQVAELATTVSSLRLELEGVLDQSPLGSAAGFGINGLKLDRAATTRLMGFARTQERMHASATRTSACHERRHLQGLPPQAGGPAVLTQLHVLPRRSPALTV